MLAPAFAHLGQRRRLLHLFKDHQPAPRVHGQFPINRIAPPAATNTISARRVSRYNAGDQLYTYVYLDPANPLSEVMLQKRPLAKGKRSAGKK